VVLWSYLVEALRRACPALGESVSMPALGAPLVIGVLLPRLVNALDDQVGSP